jgi:peptide/nickel transport system substrate-binding protein
MKSIIIYISTLCIVLTFVSCGKDSTENKDHLVFVIMKALISSLDPAFSKYNLIYGLAITFSMVYSIRRKLNINPILPNLGLFLLMQNLYLRCERTSIFKSTFYLVTIVRNCKCIWFWIQPQPITRWKVASPGGWVLQNVESFKAENDSILKSNQTFSCFPWFNDYEVPQWSQRNCIPLW